MRSKSPWYSEFMLDLKDLHGNKHPVSNIYCIGRNFAEHAHELGNAVPDEPVVFLKSTGALGPQSGEFELPAGECPHHEVEMVLWMKTAREPGAVAVGLDLTLRKLQSEFKSKGLPWARAKSFRNAALVSPLAPVDARLDLDSLELSLEVDGTLRQKGNTRDMLVKSRALIESLNRLVPLMQGDLIFTGTPKGVGEIRPGQRLLAKLQGITESTWVAASSRRSS